MSTLIIKNIAHKFLDNSINILYEPTYSLFDHMMFDLPFNFFTTSPYLTTRDNVIHPIDLSLFTYDMVFVHGIGDGRLGNGLHVPTIQYIHAFTTDNVTPSQNSFSLLEGSSVVNVNDCENISVPCPPYLIDANKEFDTVLIDCGRSRLDPKILDFFNKKIPNLHIIDNVDNIQNIAKYKTVIDLYPQNASNLMFAILHNTFYLSSPQKNTSVYANTYSSMILGGMILDVVKHNEEILTNYSKNMFNKDKSLLQSNGWTENITSYIKSIKNKGFYLS